MNILILDTETTSLDKPYCYDIGYTIIDTDTCEPVKRAHYIIEQVWHNLPLFESAYYKEKRASYVKLMRARRATLIKWGHAMQALRRDIKQYEITSAYAYNSDFDDKVITFNCNWYRTLNPLDNIPLYDIWGYASQFITNLDDYKLFCERHERFTDTGNYKGSAEVVYQYITNNPDFVEEHMGLYDSDIEAEILLHCLTMGAVLGQEYKVVKVLKRAQLKPFTIKVNGAVIYQGEYIKKYIKNDNYNFTTIGGE